MLAAKEVPAESREQRKDLAPTEEGEGAEDDEEQRVMGELNEHENGQCFQAERQRHRLLTAYVVGDPTPPRAAETVDHAVRRERELQRRQRDPQEADGDLVHLEVDSHGVELSDGHQAAGRDQRHHQVHQPELRRGPHLGGSEVHGALTPLHLFATRSLRPGPCHPPGGRGLEKQGCHHDDGSLNDPPLDEGRLVTGRADHVGNR